MFELGLSFALLVNLFIFFLVAGLGSFWVYRRFKNRSGFSFLPVIIFNLAVVCLWAVYPKVYHDEATHLHLSWLISQGLVPYKDFWYHHSPLLWLLAAPVLKLASHSVVVFSLSRIFALLLFLLNAWLGWQIAKKIWRKDANLPMYILVLSSVIIPAQYLLFRPDIFMIFFLLAGIYICLEIPEERVLPSFFAGIAFALAASFLVKQYLLILLPVITVFLGNRSRRVIKLSLYFLGLGIGIVPLLSYLVSNHILREYVYWVFYFNSKIVSFLMFFPLVILVLGAWGAVILFRRFRNSAETKALIISIGFCLSTLSSLTSTAYAHRGYYLAFWFFICAITACGCPVMAVLGRAPSVMKRSLFVAVFCSILVMPNIDLLRSSWSDDFRLDKETVSKLQKYCAGETCFCVMPVHPVFARDATRFFTYSQYLFTDDFAIVKNDINRFDIIAQIIASRPAVITCVYQNRDLFLDLFEKGLISASGYGKFISFIKQGYTQSQVGSGIFYIRNDLL